VVGAIDSESTLPAATARCSQTLPPVELCDRQHLIKDVRSLLLGLSSSPQPTLPELRVWVDIFYRIRTYPKLVVQEEETGVIRLATAAEHFRLEPRFHLFFGSSKPNTDFAKKWRELRQQVIDSRLSRYVVAYIDEAPLPKEGVYKYPGSAYRYWLTNLHQEGGCGPARFSLWNVDLAGGGEMQFTFSEGKTYRHGVLFIILHSDGKIQFGTNLMDYIGDEVDFPNEISLVKQRPRNR
jgi:hypothetical protein